MLTVSELPRVFTFKSNGQQIELADPDPTWSEERALNHYTPLYPILATATIQKPVIDGDKMKIEFSPTIGDKG